MILFPSETGELPRHPGRVYESGLLRRGPGNHVREGGRDSLSLPLLGAAVASPSDGTAAAIAVPHGRGQLGDAAAEVGQHRSRAPTPGELSGQRRGSGLDTEGQVDTHTGPVGTQPRSLNRREFARGTSHCLCWKI